jgi:hypothetical protein
LREPFLPEDYRDTCFIVRDANGQALSYVYYETEPGRRTAANLIAPLSGDGRGDGVGIIDAIGAR